MASGDGLAPIIRLRSDAEEMLLLEAAVLDALEERDMARPQPASGSVRSARLPLARVP